MQSFGEPLSRPTRRPVPDRDHRGPIRPVRAQAGARNSAGVLKTRRPSQPSTPQKGGESRVSASIYGQPARKGTTPRAAGAGRTAAPGAKVRCAGQGITTGRASRTADAPCRPQSPAAARGTGAMTALPSSRSRTHDVRGQAGPSPLRAPAAQGAPSPEHGGGALCRRNPLAASTPPPAA